MTVKSAAVAQQQLETAAAVTTVTTERRRVQRRRQVAFVAMLGVVEAAWVTLLVELVRMLV